MPLPYKRDDVYISNQSSEDWFVYDFRIGRTGLRFVATSTTHKTQLLIINMVKYLHHHTLTACTCKL